jgi:hypothetical protein
MVLAARSRAPAPAAGVAAGWDGARLVALARDDELALVWLTSWDSEADALAFFGAWLRVLATRHPETSAISNPAGHGEVATLEGAAPYHLERRGTKVLALAGALEDDLAGLADRIWKRSTFEPNVPFVPLDVAAIALER